MSGAGITIVTDWGASLGYGHVQRMAALADFILSRNSYNVTLAAQKKPDFLPLHLRNCWRPDVPSENLLIIRDRRDSSPGDIKELKQKGPVCVIDDSGPGRHIADFRIDLLPGLNHPKEDYYPECFIYGLNFITSLRELTVVRKTIDIAVYTGHNPDIEYVGFLESILPGNRECVFLSGDNRRYTNKDKQERITTRPYGELLLQSKLLITHFGISLYEGFISRCRLATINPTEYHDKLVSLVSRDMDIYNLGIYGTISKDETRENLFHLLSRPQALSINALETADKAYEKINNFYNYIDAIIQKVK